MALCKRAAILARSTVVSCSSSSSRRRRPSAVKYTASPCCLLLVMLSIILASVGDTGPARPPGPDTGTRKIVRGSRRDPLIVPIMIPHRGRKWHAEAGAVAGHTPLVVHLFAALIHWEV